MWSRAATTAIIAVLIAGATAGCGNRGNTSPGNLTTKAYPKDGMLGASQANPNLPTSHTYHTYSADTQLIKETLRQIPGIRKSTIILNGPNAYVTLDLEDNIPIEDAMRIKADAQDQVSRMMPRYNVKVRVAKSGVFQR